MCVCWSRRGSKELTHNTRKCTNWTQRVCSKSTWSLCIWLSYTLCVSVLVWTFCWHWFITPNISTSESEGFSGDLLYSLCVGAPSITVRTFGPFPRVEVVQCSTNVVNTSNWISSQLLLSAPATVAKLWLLLVSAWVSPDNLNDYLPLTGHKKHIWELTSTLLNIWGCILLSLFLKGICKSNCCSFHYTIPKKLGHCVKCE